MLLPLKLPQGHAYEHVIEGPAYQWEQRTESKQGPVERQRHRLPFEVGDAGLIAFNRSTTPYNRRLRL